MRILVAEDDPISRLLITRFLGTWGYDVVSAGDGAQAWQVLQREDSPEMAILDWMMPGLDGLEICRRMRALDGPYRYVLMLTSRTAREDLLQALESGADDYLIKPIDAAALKARLKIGQRILELQQRLVEAVDRSRFEASHDSLTGIWNRGAILEFLRGQFARSGRDGISLAIALADIDHFKAINDTYGHQAGDSVLREVAQRIRRSLRPYDWVGRYGGEEFLIIAPDCTLANGFSMCERVRMAICGTPVNFQGSEFEVAASFGLATTAETGAVNEENLLRSADAALYVAKAHGRNRVEMARRIPKTQAAQIRAATDARRKELVQ